MKRYLCLVFVALLLILLTAGCTATTEVYGTQNRNSSSSNDGGSYETEIMFVGSSSLNCELENKLFDLIQCDEFYEDIQLLLHEFGLEQNWYWQAGLNGRSNGYLVLYQGESKPSGYKSYCPSCTQRCYKSIIESSDSGKCGACNADRVDYTSTHMTISRTGRSIDDYEDFEDWETGQLRDRVQLIQAFDKLADKIVQHAVYLAENYQVQEEEYFIKSTRLALTPIGA